jgi:hypothetical protein
MGAAGALVAGIAGATWMSTGGGKTDAPLFVQSAEISDPVRTTNWPAPSAAKSGSGSIAYLNEWINLVTPLKPHPETADGDKSSSNVADSGDDAPAANASPVPKTSGAAPHETIRELPLPQDAQGKKEKRVKRKAARTERKRRDREDADRGDHDQTVGQGARPVSRSADRDEREDTDEPSTRRRHRDRDHGYRHRHDERDETVGVHRAERGDRVDRDAPPPEVRVLPEGPERPDRPPPLFGLFGSGGGGF